MSSAKDTEKITGGAGSLDLGFTIPQLSRDVRSLALIIPITKPYFNQVLVEPSCR